METWDLNIPTSKHPEVGVLLGALDDSTREWKGELGEPSIEALRFQPVAGGPSVGSQLLHIIGVELYWFERVIGDQPRDMELGKLLMVEDFDVDNGQWPTPPEQPLSWYYDLLNQVRERAWKSVIDEDPRRMAVRSDSQLSVQWILAHVVQHDSYHGGQAVLLHEQWKAAQLG